MLLIGGSLVFLVYSWRYLSNPRVHGFYRFFGWEMTLILTVFAFISFGLTIAPIFVMNPGVRQWQNGLEFPVYVLCGFLFPITMLPGWTTPISYLLPPYWAAVALHGTSTAGTALSRVFFASGMMVLFSILDLFIASRHFRLLLYKARADATLGME